MTDSTEATRPADIVCRVEGSTVQHGPLNRRVYLMEFVPGRDGALLQAIEKLCRENGYTKVFAKVPQYAAPRFLADGYLQEAFVPGFYRGETDGIFMGKFYDEARSQVAQQEIEALADALERGAGAIKKPVLPDGWELFFPGPADCGEMAALYRQVFASYPFPIDDPAYLANTMEDNVLYAGVRCEGRLVGLASAEMNPQELHAEMTDFAVLPEARGRRLGILLLQRLEQQVLQRGMRTLYTIARLAEPGMNLTFARCGYRFSGILSRNTCIGGGLESMVVWYRRV